MMDFVAACELGRQSVNSVNASVLGTVLRELVARYQQSRRAKLQVYDTQIRCIEHLELLRRKNRKLGEDEGFESDEDAASTTSSCCLVDDHVFKEQKDVDRSSPSGISGSTDSANSSGSSDTDDTDVRTPSPLEKLIPETYMISDVIICHTEPRYLNTIAWVIKRNMTHFDTSSRLGKTGVENSNDNCLEVIVIKCKMMDDFKKLCSSYREASRRSKLDQYKSVTRKKPYVLSTLTDTKDLKVSLSDMKIAKSSLLKASELSILNPKILNSFKSDMKNSVSLSSLLKTESASNKAQYMTKDEAMKKSSSLSNISPEKFNLLHRTDMDGMTHIEISKSSTKSKIQKEIEGVILTEVESNVKKDCVRQRQNSSGAGELRVWRPNDSIDTPPLRPERRKYSRKKQIAHADLPTQNYGTLPNISEAKRQSKFYLPIQNEESRHKTVHQNQYTRLGFWDDCEIANTVGSLNRSVNTMERLSRASEERCADRRRTRSVGRTGRKTPMTYRYIDQPSNALHLVMIDRTDKKEILRRRRNSFDEIVHHKSTLKSVIKSSKNKLAEPKKVTFSAFATVQVVD